MSVSRQPPPEINSLNYTKINEEKRAQEQTAIAEAAAAGTRQTFVTTLNTLIPSLTAAFAAARANPQQYIQQAAVAVPAVAAPVGVFQAIRAAPPPAAPITVANAERKDIKRTLAPWGVVYTFIQILTRGVQKELDHVFDAARFRKLMYAIPDELKDESLNEHALAERADQTIPILRNHLLDILPRCMSDLNWVIEKTFFSVRNVMHPSASITLFDLLANETTCSEFAALCFLVYQDIAVDSGRKYAPANVTVSTNEAKNKLLAGFAALPGAPPRNALEMVAFVVPPKQAQFLEEGLANRLVRQYFAAADEEKYNASDFNEPNVSTFLALDYDTPYYKQPLLGYFLRLLNQAIGRRVDTDVFIEEATDLNPSFKQTYIGDLAGPAAITLRRVVMELFEMLDARTDVTLGATFPRHVPRNESLLMRVLDWLCTERSRCIQGVRLISLTYLSRDRIADRQSAAIEPVIVRKMLTSVEHTRRWFVEERAFG